MPIQAKSKVNKLRGWFLTVIFYCPNTVSIIVADDTAKQLAEDGDLTPAKPARLLDIFVCINQGYLMAHKHYY